MVIKIEFYLNWERCIARNIRLAVSNIFTVVIILLSVTRLYSQTPKPVYTFNGYNSGLFSVQKFIPFQDKLYTLVSVAQVDQDLYVTDGTPNGTMKISQGIRGLTYLVSNSDALQFR